MGVSDREMPEMAYEAKKLEGFALRYFLINTMLLCIGGGLFAGAWFIESNLRLVCIIGFVGLILSWMILDKMVFVPKLKTCPKCCAEMVRSDGSEDESKIYYACSKCEVRWYTGLSASGD